MFLTLTVTTLRTSYRLVCRIVRSIARHPTINTTFKATLNALRTVIPALQPHRRLKKQMSTIRLYPYATTTTSPSYSKNKLTPSRNTTTRLLLTSSILYLLTLTTAVNGAADQVLSNSLVLSATLTLVSATVSIPNRLYTRSIWLYGVMTLFILFTALYVQVDHALTLFLIYELFLLTAAAVLASSSPNKRAVRTSFYFLLWTQAGSMLVALGLFINVWTAGTPYISNWSNLATWGTLIAVAGFSVKIPVFPFFFWLTKTHVEAVTSFSIFLSGFLVKLALFGIFKLGPSISANSANTIIAVSAMSASIATVGFLYQTDYKKLIAYATIQEMGVLLLLLITGYQQTYAAIANLLLIHTALSALFFLLSDSLYKRFNTRSVFNMQGIMLMCPKLSLVVLSSVIIFKGLPLTTKYGVEVALYTTLLNHSTPLFIVMLASLTALGGWAFSALHFKIIFGTPTNTSLPDLTRTELLTFLLLSTSLCLVVI